MNHITAISTIAVPVTAQDRAVAFYVDTLGFDLHFDAELPQLNGRWIVVAPPGATTTLALIPTTDQTPTGADTGIRLTTPNAAAAHAALTAQSVAVDALLSWPGVPPMFTLHDPDGNTLYLVEG
ncbi:VOC family protein [Kribbella italica]|uniref:Catechol 2,3-dioxygenase-like lactoylglutathione lyase family enzyme n=1 Tax=Kribbella italica TaxID=1540520 RepID=A0A7W9J2V0_9ACTN|nr:VOC family protein [Kribbella italica]MBB5834335.1 catechol 2,3-dioxygenase-like lactoylglutathione lyase family enzyme [Kribbella italica]